MFKTIFFAGVWWVAPVWLDLAEYILASIGPKML